jgi:hypothetical protein
MVISHKIFERKIGYRGSKSNTSLFVKEQRADGSCCNLNNYLQLRCALMGFERNYQIKILSKQLILNKRNFSTLVQNNNLNPGVVTGFCDAAFSKNLIINKLSTKITVKNQTNLSLVI